MNGPRVVPVTVLLALLVGLGACATSVPGTAAPAQFPAAAVQFRPVVSQIPPGASAPPADAGEVLPAREGTGATGSYVVGAPVIDGGAVAGAEVTQSQVNGTWVVRLALTSAGSAAFGTFTADNVGSIVAIVVNGEVISAPVITGPIYGAIDIAGTFTRDDAERLAAGIRGDR